MTGNNTRSEVSAAPPSLAEQFSVWSQSRAKRVFDLACAIPLTLVTLPIMAALAIIIPLVSPGPALYRQRRCGKGGREFQLLKFRSMQHNCGYAGPALTKTGDPRITPIGRLLRKWKLDELPQLFNVLRGEMSMVGPRPDTPQYVHQLTVPQCITAVTPGITSPASLKFYNEEEVIAAFPPDQTERLYVTTLLPEKVAIELEYARTATLVSDAAILLRTAATILRTFRS